jgi:hypothetical protein
MDGQTFLNNYVNALNEAVKNREFFPFVQQWYAPDAEFRIAQEENGLEKTLKVWQHVLPVGIGGEQRTEVVQVPYKVEGGRCYSWRAVQGRDLPRPLYGLQETEFDDRMLISDIIVRSVQDKPEVEEDPRAAKSRVGRIFLAFAEAFNDFFVTGDPDIVAEWCAPDIHMAVDSTFWGMGVIAPHFRIPPDASFSLREIEKADGEELKAQVDFVNWGGIDKGTAPWDIVKTPDDKIRVLHTSMQI